MGIFSHVNCRFIVHTLKKVAELIRKISDFIWDKHVACSHTQVIILSEIISQKNNVHAILSII